MSKQITVTISGGKAVVKTEGYIGSECKDATKALQAALGTTVSDDDTPEMHATSAQSISQS